MPLAEADLLHEIDRASVDAATEPGHIGVLNVGIGADVDPVVQCRVHNTPHEFIRRSANASTASAVRPTRL